MADWEDVQRGALALPEVEEGSSYGSRAWTVRKKGFVWERPLRRGDLEALGAAAPDGPVLAARVADVGVKEALIADNPDAFFTTPHFNGYPAVLIRLDRISVPELDEVVVDAWLARAPKRLATQYLAEVDERPRRARSRRSAGRCPARGPWPGSPGPRACRRPAARAARPAAPPSGRPPPACRPAAAPPPGWRRPGRARSRGAGRRAPRRPPTAAGRGRRARPAGPGPGRGTRSPPRCRARTPQAAAHSSPVHTSPPMAQPPR